MAEAAEGRTRYREQVRLEIKQVALRQIARDGAAALTLTGIAKEIGVSGQALYRYFASSDDLLTELIVDSYASLAESVSTAAAESAGSAARERLHAVARAYRGWAVAQPRRYLLLAGTPAPRHDASPEAADIARAVLVPLLEILIDGVSRPHAAMPRADVPPTADGIAQAPGVPEWVRETLGPAWAATPEVVLAGVMTVWARLHGVVSLEAAGLFADIGLRPSAVLSLEIDALADAAGLD